MQIKDEVADTVRAEMARHRVSQREVATALRISQAAVSRRLMGDVEFSISELATIANLLQIPLGDLLPIPPAVPASRDVDGTAGTPTALAEGGDAA